MVVREETQLVRWTEADLQALPDDHGDHGRSATDGEHPYHLRPHGTSRKRLTPELFTIVLMFAGAFLNAAWVLFG